MDAESIDAYIRAVPKAELHVHLEGAILPETLLDLAHRNRVQLPYDTPEGLQQWFVFRDFPHFVEIYGAISRCLRTVEDYELITYEFGREMARQNTCYAEVTFSPAFHQRMGVDHDVYFRGLSKGRERARADFGVEINWVFDIIRSFTGDPAYIHQWAEYTVDVAVQSMGDGVMALGLGGYEVGCPPEPFERHFDRARAAGLRSAPHAGETAGPASIWGAIRHLGAERIGHGVRSIEDPELVEYLVASRIPIEVNPNSNLRLGVYADLSAHPLRRLYEAGVELSVNSDDPPLFSTTLTDDLLTLPRGFGFDIEAIDTIILNGVRHSFLAVDRRVVMESAFQAEMAALKERYRTLEPT